MDYPYLAEHEFIWSTIAFGSPFETIKPVVHPVAVEADRTVLRAGLWSDKSLQHQFLDCLCDLLPRGSALVVGKKLRHPPIC